MKLLCDISTKDIESYINSGVDSFILNLEDFSVSGDIYFTLDEIKDITNKYDKEFFINMNKNMFNSDLDELELILGELSKLNIKGILFYDISILELKKKNNLDIELVWYQEHMTTNYNTCNYYYDRGVKYSFLSSEITLDEIIEIKNKSNITPFVFVFGMNNVAFSRRKLITNYYKNLELESRSRIDILEKVSNDKYLVVEDKNGSSFILEKIMNGISVIKELYDNKFDYIVFREMGINHLSFLELVDDTKKYIDNGCVDSNYLDKYRKLYGNETGFLFKKSIYRVK